METIIDNFEEKMTRQGLMLVLSSPSGAGKSSLAKMLCTSDSLSFSISATTRPIRASERDGVDYHFFTINEFEKKIEEGAFIEWAKVHGNYYGTLKSSVVDAIHKGYDLLFDIDYNGMLQLKKQLPNYMVSVFILPPSIGKLRERLSNRCENSSQDIENRLCNAYSEIEQYVHFDYVIINYDLQDSYNKLAAIYEAEKLRRSRVSGLDNFVKKLLSQF